MYSDEFIQKMKTKLEEEKATVEAKLKELNAPEAEMDNPDWDDKGNDAAEDILEDGLRANYNNVLEKVTKALAKIESKTYGVCEETQELIPEDVLEAVPWAEFCRQPNHIKE